MLHKDILLKAYRHMHSAKIMAETYEANRTITKYVHSTSRGHEAIQLATAFQLGPQDWVSPYYRDESLLLGMGWTPYQLMLQLLAKADDPFTGGRSYYAHANSKDPDKPVIIHQSSATGMQVIPGIASKAFDVVAEQQANVLMISQASSENNICFVINEAEAPRVGSRVVDVECASKSRFDYVHNRRQPASHPTAHFRGVTRG